MQWAHIQQMAVFTGLIELTPPKFLALPCQGGRVPSGQGLELYSAGPPLILVEPLLYVSMFLLVE